MGVAFWSLCGLAGFAASRAIAVGRDAAFAGELFVAILVSALAGPLATALDFGGWGEIDWRAGAFIIGCVFAAIGCRRAVRLAMRGAAGR